MTDRPREQVLTPHLRCEPLRAEHVEELTRLLLDPRVNGWLLPGSQPTRREVMAGAENAQRHWEVHGLGLWLLRDRLTSEMVGRGGVRWAHVRGTLELEAAWAIVPERWGQGLATELAHAAVGTAFEVLEVPSVIAFTLPANLASRRVMEKARFAFEREIQYGGLPHVLYRRSR